MHKIKNSNPGLKDLLGNRKISMHDAKTRSFDIRLQLHFVTKIVLTYWDKNVLVMEKNFEIRG